MPRPIAKPWNMSRIGTIWPRIVGSTPRILTYVQLAAVPIGAAAVAIMYPLLVRKYGLGVEGVLLAAAALLAWIPRLH